MDTRVLQVRCSQPACDSDRSRVAHDFAVKADIERHPRKPQAHSRSCNVPPPRQVEIVTHGILGRTPSRATLKERPLEVFGIPQKFTTKQPRSGISDLCPDNLFLPAGPL